MSDINTYADEAAITNAAAINGDLVLNRDNNSLYLCTNADAAGINRWKKFTNDGAAAPILENRWGAHFNTVWSSTTATSSVDRLYLGYRPAPSNNLSISWWFKGVTNDVTRSLSPIMGSSSAGPYAPYLVASQSANRSLLIAWNRNQSAGAESTGWGFGGTDSMDDFIDGNWHHIVLVVSEVVGESKTKVTLYRDGSHYGEHEGVANRMYTGPYVSPSGSGALTQYTIGSLSNTSNSYVFGDYIDDVAFFEDALTPENVTFMYNGGKPGDVYDLDPKCWFRFGDHESDSPSAGGLIASVTDSSAYGNTVTTVANAQPSYLDLTGETIYS